MMQVKFVDRLEVFSRLAAPDVKTCRLNSQFELRKSGKEVKAGDIEELNQGIATLRRKLNKRECRKLYSPAILKSLPGVFRNLRILSTHLGQNLERINLLASDSLALKAQVKPKPKSAAELVEKDADNNLILISEWPLILGNICDNPSRFLRANLKDSQLKKLICGPSFDKYPFLFIGILFGDSHFRKLAKTKFNSILKLNIPEAQLFCRKLEDIEFQDTYSVLELLKCVKSRPKSPQMELIIQSIHKILQKVLVQYLNSKTNPIYSFLIEDADLQTVVSLLVSNQALYALVHRPKLSLRTVPNVRAEGLNCLVRAFPQIDILHFKWTEPKNGDLMLIPNDSCHFVMNSSLLSRLTPLLQKPIAEVIARGKEGWQPILEMNQGAVFLIIKWLEIIHQPNIDVHSISPHKLSYFGVDLTYENAVMHLNVDTPAVQYNHISSFERFIEELYWAYENQMTNLLSSMDEIFCLLANKHSALFREFINRLSTIPEPIKLKIYKLYNTQFVQKLHSKLKIP